MRGIFNPDAPIIQAMSKFSWMLWYSCLWVFCSLPIVTVGASSVAMYRMAFYLREEGDYNTKNFFLEFKNNFKKATALWLVILLLAAVLAVAYYGVVWIEDQTVRTAMLAPFCVCFVVWGFVLIYVFPLTAFFENTVKNTLKNAVAMGIKHLRQSIYCFALALIPVLALALSVEWFVRLLYVWVFMYPCVAAYWIGGILKPVFQSYVPEETEETAESEEE